MAKRLFLLLSFAFCLQFAVAQTMSDQQVLQFIASEQEKGTSQNVIATKLLQKGVTPEQLRKIKAKYNAENSMPGAANLTGVSRSRVAKQKNEEERQKQVAGMVSSESSKNRTYTRKEQISTLEDEMGFLYNDSIYMSQVFGRNLFNNEYLTFESALNIPTPADYVLGAGDYVYIDIWGASQDLIEAEITPDGKVIIEGAGPLHIAGKTVEEANRYLQDALGKIYAESSINLTVGTVRTIQVQVVGEVFTPGNYTMSALSTAFNALYAAGGISELGTLRAIKVYRNNKLISTIDVYDYIFNGNANGSLRLQDNDVISVGAYDAIVSIDGKVKRPMKYEAKEGESLSQLIKFAGGFTGDAYKENVRVVRKSGREYSLFTVARKDMSKFTMCDGDSITIDSVIPRFSNMIEINGAVFYPGQYQFGEDVNTIKELVVAAGGIREDAFLNRAVLHHRNLDNTIDAQSIDLNGILNGTSKDVTLRNNDVLFVPSKTDMRGEQIVKISGEVRFPGDYKYASNTKVEDLILQAGGFTENASVLKIEVLRQAFDTLAMEKSNNLTDVYHFEVKNGFVVDGGSDFALQPNDVVIVRSNPQRVAIQTAKIQGAVNFEGEYAIQTKNYRVSDIIEAAGGLIEQAYIEGAYLLRKMTEKEKQQRKSISSISRNALYEDMLKSNFVIDVAILDTLHNSKISMDDWYSVPIKLENILKQPGCDDDLLLRGEDIIYVPEYNSTVRISGEIEFPTTVNWVKGKSLKYYIDQAGGFSSIAKKNKVYTVQMDGSIKKVSKNSKRAIRPGCEIVVPRKPVRKKMTTAEIISISTSTASIATVLITLANMLK